MTFKKLILPLLSLIFLGLLSCEKDDRDKATFQLEFEPRTSNFVLNNAPANSLEFTSGQIILESVEFETSSDTDTLEMEFEIDAFITVDFATGATNPDLSAIEIRPGRYTEIEIEIELWDQSDQPSIVLDGTWTDAEASSHPVKFMFYSGQDFSLEIEGDFTVEVNTTMIAQIKLDPAVWFSGVPPHLFASAAFDNNGVIVISPDMNTGIYDMVENMIDLVSEVEITMENL